MNRDAGEVREVSPGYELTAARPAVPEGYKQTEVGVIPGEWEVKRLREISPRQSVELVINPSTYFDRRGTVPILVGSNVQENHVDWSSARRITKESNEKLPASQIYTNDLVMVRVGEPGVTAVISSEYSGSNCASMMIVRSSQSFDSNWLCYLMNSDIGRNHVRNVQYGTAQKQFNISDAVDFIYPVPPKTEQSVIATALSDVDALLEELDRLIAKKRDIKQATMQQLLTGQTRLPGFEGEWETKRIGELLTICHGRNQHEVEVKDGQFPILATSGIIGTSKRALYNRPSVLIGRKGTINKPRYMDTPFWSVDTLFYSVIEGDNDAKYLYYQLLMIDWLQYNEASGVPSLSARTIENIEITCPQPLEQRAISLALSDLDAEIKSIEQRRTKTAAIKQAMMQDLLTGRTRLSTQEVEK